MRQWQTFFYDEGFSHVDLSFQPDFVKLAESFGGIGFKVEKARFYSRTSRSDKKQKDLPY